MSSGSYRYGFNGKENDGELKGSGNQQDYGERIYDTRAGRFLSTDPLTRSYPMLSPYQYASNNPIYNIDIDGLEGSPYTFVNFLSDPGGTTMKGVRWVNSNINPFYIGVDHVAKISTGEDLEGTPVDSRGRTGAIADAGVDILMYFTFARFLKGATKTDPLQAQMNQNARASGTPPAKPAQSQAMARAEAQNAPVVKPKIQPQQIQQAQAKAGSSSGIPPLSNKPLIPSQINNGCEEVAVRVQKSIGGEFLQITPGQGNFLGPVNYAEGTVNNWAHHVAVIKNGVVYDAMTGSNGMVLDKYKAMFEYADALKFETVKKMTLK